MPRQTNLHVLYRVESDDLSIADGLLFISYAVAVPTRYHHRARQLIVANELRQKKGRRWRRHSMFGKWPSAWLLAWTVTASKRSTVVLLQISDSRWNERQRKAAMASKVDNNHAAG